MSDPLSIAEKSVFWVAVLVSTGIMTYLS